MNASRSPGPAEAVAACALSAALLIGLVAKEWSQLSPGDTSRDFPLLYAAAERTREGQPLYAQTDPALPGPLLNFNPPHFHTVLVPFTAFPLRVAYLAWTAVSLALLFSILRVAFNDVGIRLGAPARWLTIAGILASAGVAATIRMGQVSMWVALLITLAWRAARRGRSFSTGVWLGLAISVKPFLLLGLPVLLVRGRLHAAGIAGIVGAVAVASGGVWLGWSALGGWLEVLQSPRRATSFPFNASVSGIVARGGMPDEVGYLLSATIAAYTLWRVRRSDEDNAWALWITASLLCSPLGWIYYLPLLIAPVFALAATGRLPRRILWLAPAFLPPPVSPVLFQDPIAVAVTIGSVYGWALLGLWIVLLASQRGASERSGSYLPGMTWRTAAADASRNVSVPSK